RSAASVFSLTPCSPQRISNRAAAPMPAPTHMVTTAYFSPRRPASAMASMANRDRATVHVETRGINPKRVAAQHGPALPSITTSPVAPSENCEAFPAVIMPVSQSTGLEKRERFERGLGAHPLVACQRHALGVISPV